MTLLEALAVERDLMAQIASVNGFHYQCVQDLIIQAGERYSACKLPADVKLGQPKRCFENALRLVLADNDLVYVEGYAMRPNLPLPMHHAWCVDASGHVVDPTWEYRRGTEYRGLPFNRHDLIAIVMRTSVYGVLDGWKHGFPELRHQWSGSAGLAEWYVTNVRPARAGRERSTVR